VAKALAFTPDEQASQPPDIAASNWNVRLPPKADIGGRRPGVRKLAEAAIPEIAFTIREDGSLAESRTTVR
jgi:hypothetical protein